ncbi:helix-turn-helix transcriptional regulator [Tetragenococcus halophilus]
MELDKRLKVARKNAGLSQNEVAEKLHISRQAISQWENGRSYPDLDKPE